MWYHNTFLLQSNDRISTYSHGNKYTLRIRNFHMSDFGNYRFVNFHVAFLLYVDEGEKKASSIFQELMPIDYDSGTSVCEILQTASDFYSLSEISIIKKKKNKGKLGIDCCWRTFQR